MMHTPLDRHPRIERVARKDVYEEIEAAVCDYEASYRKADNCLWRIGDLCGLPGRHGVNNGSLVKLEAIASKLRRKGYRRFGVEFLRKLRSTAARFPDGKRLPSVDWSCHHAAGDPEMLNAAIAQAKQDGVNLTVDFVEGFVDKFRQRTDKKDKTKPPNSTSARVLALTDTRHHGAEYCNALRRLQPHVPHVTPLERKECITLLCDVIAASKEMITAFEGAAK